LKDLLADNIYILLAFSSTKLHDFQSSMVRYTGEKPCYFQVAVNIELETVKFHS